MDKLTAVFVGGTRRAEELFRHIVNNRRDVRISYAIFMKGYTDEHIYSEMLSSLASTHDVEYTVADKITDEIEQYVQSLNVDVIIGGGIWRSMLKPSFFNAAKHGYIGLHGSGLPAYRGWAGINWYIINGEKEYKLRMFQLADGVDNGPLIADGEGRLLEYSIAIDNEKHIADILEELYPLHVRAYDDLFNLLLAGDIQFVTQDESQASYTCHRGPEDAEVDWTRSTYDVFNFIRAQSTPYPGAFTYFDGQKVTLLTARPRYDYSNYIGRIPGKVVTRDKATGTVVILTGDGGIEIRQCSVAGEITDKPLNVFTSVRKKCQTKLEALCKQLLEAKTLI